MSADDKDFGFTEAAALVTKRTRARTVKADKLVYRPELPAWNADSELQRVGGLVMEMITALAEVSPDHALLKHPMVRGIQKRAVDHAEKQRQTQLADLARREKRKQDREAALAKLTPEERKVFGFK